MPGTKLQQQQIVLGKGQGTGHDERVLVCELMKAECYLGVDLGAESGRVMAGLWEGSRMHIEEIHRFPNGPVEIAGTLRWDVLRLWSEVQHGLALAARTYGNSVKSV